MVAPPSQTQPVHMVLSAKLKAPIFLNTLSRLSVRFGNMAIHVEVPGDFGQGEFNPIKLRSENDLTSQPGVLLQHRRHVKHVILPMNGYMCQ